MYSQRELHSELLLTFAIVSSINSRAIAQKLVNLAFKGLDNILVKVSVRTQSGYTFIQLNSQLPWDWDQSHLYKNQESTTSISNSISLKWHLSLSTILVKS